MKSTFLLFIMFVAQVAIADLSYTESNDLQQCAEQFGLIEASEVGEDTGMLEVSNFDGVRVYELVQGSQSRGFLQIDVQGDITAVDESGNFLQACQ